MHFRHETAARQNDRPHGVVAVAAVGDAAAAVVEGDRKAAVGAGAAVAKRLPAVEGKSHKAEMERLNKEASDWIYYRERPCCSSMNFSDVPDRSCCCL